MSIWTSIRDKAIKPLVNLGATAVGTYFGGPVGGAVASGVMGGGKDIGTPGPGPPVTTAGTAAGGLTQTLPVLYNQGGMSSGPGVGGGTPPTLSTQLGALAGNFLRGTPIGGGVRKMTRGKLTGNAIPAGYVEKMSPAGVIYLGKRSRRRGISSRDLSSFRRVERLIHRYSRPHTTRPPRRK